MEADPDPKVRYQLLCTLGFIHTPQAARVRQQLLFKDIEDEWVQVAALSAPASHKSGLLEAKLTDFRQDIPAYAALVKRLSAMAGASGQREKLAQADSKSYRPRIREK
jgi:hypothetical protein